ncbi:MAG TPA: restriction endonuclease subunit S [Oscillospiraceae bacterium]|uniref:restriction endonuclease subunit S n=1 Tax=Ruminococcus callidus TaxID=40519 RepID=UPI00399431D3|nr:restriction endonuclease subunit S [Oscillospiraceae bacterium]
MTSNWKTCQLGELVTFTSGGTPSKKKAEYWNGSIPWISAKTMKDEHISTSDLMISEEGLKNGSRLAPQGSILFLIRGSGLFNGIPICLVDKPVAFNQDVKCINSISEIENKYVFYWLLSQASMLSAIVGVTTIGAGKFDMDVIKRLEISYPEKEVRNEIIRIADAISDKIRLNTAINENLELQAQAIFKSWFVDFEPFGGVMPEDWRTGSLSEICGYSKDKVNIEDLTLETYYSTENMQPNRQGAVQATTLPTIKQTTACKKGDVLISNIRPYFKKIIYCFADCGCSTDVLCFVPNKSEYSTFLYCALYSDKFFDYMVAGSKGTKMPRGDKQQIMMYPICIPSTEYVEQFSKIVAPMLEIVYTNRLEANDLAILRDTLLPKLMNGEIDVSEVKI